MTSGCGQFRMDTKHLNKSKKDKISTEIATTRDLEKPTKSNCGDSHGLVDGPREVVWNAG